MIHFKKIRWRNFISTGSQFTEIQLDKNSTTLIVGENGAGKSTLLDALTFVLYNKPFRKVNKPQLVNSITQKNLLVEVEFETGKKSYRVRRGIKPALFEIYQDGTLVNQDAANRDYQDFLERSILKLNYKSFIQIVILGRANFTPFMQLPAQGRRQIIEDFLDIQIYSSMNALLKERVAQNKSAIVDAEYNIRLLQSKIEMNRQHVESMKANTDELIQDKHNKILQYEDESEKALSALDTLTKNLESLQKKLESETAIQSTLTKLTRATLQHRKKQKTLETTIEFYRTSDTCNTCHQEIQQSFKDAEIAKTSSTLQATVGLLETAEGKAQSLRDKLEAFAPIKVEFDKITKQMGDINVRLQTNKRFISALKKEIKELQNKMATQADDKSAELGAELHAARNELKQQLLNREVYEFAAQLLKDGGIKARIIKQYIPVMNALINKYLAAMDFFVQFTLDEEFNECIRSRFRDEFSYESFSEGEKLRLDLALLFSWRALAKIRSSMACNILILDEIFDSSLDVNGIEEFLKIMNSVAKEANIFVISHRGDQLFDRFKNVLKFEKKRNFSRIAA